MSFAGRQTKPVLISFAQWSDFEQCPRCGSFIPSDAYKWHVGTENYCATCVPVMQQPTTGWV